MEDATTIAEHIASGVAHHAAGRFAQAVERYSQALTARPDLGEAWRLLGVVALQSGDPAAARGLLERALRIDPADAAAWSALGSVHEALENRDAAFTAYTHACAGDAGNVPAAVGFMRVALGLGRVTDALTVGQAAVAQGASDAGLFRVLGAVRLTLRDDDGAAAMLRSSIEIAPHPDAYANLAAAYVHLRDVDAAIVACEHALALDPAHAAAAKNLGIASEGGIAAPPVFAAIERAVAAGSEEARVVLGAAYLLRGDYRRGWPLFGWVTPERRANPAFAALPMWDGTEHAGRLLIWPEQGIGDTIQMLRFLRSLRGRAGSVTLACPPGTRDLFAGVDGADDRIDTRQGARLDDFDAWLPTVRLPLVLDVEPHAIPGAAYLRADPQRIARWRTHLDRAGPFRVGLVWSGNPDFAWNAIRSCSPADFGPFRDIAGVTWFSLQVGAANRPSPPDGLSIVRLDAAIADFADTAALIEALDLVITVDTSVANLAGALGKSAWVLLSNRPDWRWQASGEVSPWYPTLRLFRQGPEGTWAPVIEAVAARLRAIVGASPMPPIDCR